MTFPLSEKPHGQMSFHKQSVGLSIPEVTIVGDVGESKSLPIRGLSYATVRWESLRTIERAGNRSHRIGFRRQHGTQATIRIDLDCN